MKMKSRGGNGGDFKSPGTPDRDSPTTKKKRRTSTAPATPPAMQSSPMPELVPPPPITGYGDTIIASNPFDDMPSPSSRGHPGSSGGGGGGPGPGGHPGGPGGCGPPPNMGMGGGGPRGPPPPGFQPGPPHGHPGHGHGHPGGGGHGPPPGHGGNMGMGGGPPPQGMMRMGCPPGGGHGHPGGGGGPQMGPGGPNNMPPQWNNGPKPPIPPIQSGKMYPPDQPMIFNPQNPNAPPIYPCGLCHKEVHDNDQAIPCESGCHFWFHRICTGLTEAAFYYLNHEVYAEWVCDNCLSSKNIPLVKFKP